MQDILLVTIEHLRSDYVNEMDFLSSFKIHEGTIAGHYTRPSLASLHSSDYVAAAKSGVVQPTLAQVLNNEGYECCGLAANPQVHETFGFDAGFDRYDTFVEKDSEGSKIREFFSQFEPLRYLYHRFFPPKAKLSGVPRDKNVVDSGIKWFNSAGSPRFLWIHFMEPHRPYGRDDEAVPTDLDRKALFSPSRLSNHEQQTIKKKYITSLKRVDKQLQRLLKELDSDPLFICSGDHGEELGDEGKYFIQPQRMRLVDCIVNVPVIFSGVNITNTDEISLIDIGPTVATHCGAEVPETWDGIPLQNQTRSHALTIASWDKEASVRWKQGTKKLFAHGDVWFENDERNAENSQDVPDEVEDQLRNLGYVN